MDYYAMRQLRELRELDEDYTHLTGHLRARMDPDSYNNLHRKLIRRRESLESDLYEHLKTL